MKRTYTVILNLLITLLLLSPGITVCAQITITPTRTAAAPTLPTGRPPNISSGVGTNLTLTYFDQDEIISSNIFTNVTPNFQPPAITDVIPVTAGTSNTFTENDTYGSQSANWASAATYTAYQQAIIVATQSGGVVNSVTCTVCGHGYAASSTVPVTFTPSSTGVYAVAHFSTDANGTLISPGTITSGGSAYSFAPSATVPTIVGRTGTIASNLAKNGSNNIIYTVSDTGTGLNNFNPGDYVVIHQQPIPSPSGYAGTTGTGIGLSGAATASYETTNLPTSGIGVDAQQALSLTTSTGSANITAYADTGRKKFITISGAWSACVTYYESGTAVPFSFTASRYLVNSGTTENIASGSITTTSGSWQTSCYNFTGTETASTLYGVITLQFHVPSNFTGDLIYLSVAPAASSYESANIPANTYMMDSFIDNYLTFIGGPSQVGGYFTSRGWYGMAAMPVHAMLVGPSAAEQAGIARNGANFSGTYAGVEGGLPLTYIQQIALDLVLQTRSGKKAIPTFVIPTDINQAGAQLISEFLFGSCSTNGGKLRCDQGSAFTAPVTGPGGMFPYIKLTLGNEMWNPNSFIGQSFYYNPYIVSGDCCSMAPTGMISNLVYSWIQADAAYSAGYADFSLTTQLGSSNNEGVVAESMCPLCTEFEDAPYTGGGGGSRNYNATLDIPALLTEPYVDLNTTGGNLYGDITNNGYGRMPTVRKCTFYEYGQSDLNVNGFTGSTQRGVYEFAGGLASGLNVADLYNMSETNGCYGTKTIFTYGQWHQAGPINTDAFATSGHNCGPATSGNYVTCTPVWGIVEDVAGEGTVRPEFLVNQNINKAVIGTYVTATSSGIPTYNLTSSPGWIPNESNVPCVTYHNEYNGNNSSMHLVNKCGSSYTVTIAGSYAPTGTITTSTVTSSNLTDNNETEPLYQITSSGGTSTATMANTEGLPFITGDMINIRNNSSSACNGNFGPITTTTYGTLTFPGSCTGTGGFVTNSPNQVGITTGTSSNPVTIPAYSDVTLLYSTSITVATPVITLAGGSYGSAQSTTITDSTSGATIYYTQDGSTPSATNGNVYSSAVPITFTQNLKAIAIASGSNSSVASTSYTITTGSTVTTVNLNQPSVPGYCYVGQTCNLQAIMGSSTATGIVTFSLSGTPLGTAVLVNGQATFTINTQTYGDVTYGATYGGDANYAPITTSNNQSFLTMLTPVRTALTSSNLVAASGASVTFTATTTCPLPACVTPSQPVGYDIFYDHYTVRTTATATANAITMTVASNTGIQVKFGVGGRGVRRGTYVKSISGTTITLSQPLLLPMSTTNVTFTGTQVLGGAVVATNSSGVATYTTSSLLAGVQHYIKAVFLGDGATLGTSTLWNEGPSLIVNQTITTSATACSTTTPLTGAPAVFYVASNGVDTAAGTCAAPFLTVGHAVSQLTTAGSVILIREGDRYSEAVEATGITNAAGTSTPYVFGEYVGAGRTTTLAPPVITARDLMSSPTWTLVSGTTYSTPFTGYPAKVFIDSVGQSGLPLRPAPSFQGPFVANTAYSPYTAVTSPHGNSERLVGVSITGGVMTMTVAISSTGDALYSGDTIEISNAKNLSYLNGLDFMVQNFQYVGTALGNFATFQAANPNFSHADTSFTLDGNYITSVSITGNVLSVTVPNSFVTGNTVQLDGFTDSTLTFLNGLNFTVAAGATSTTFTAAYTHANLLATTPTANTGYTMTGNAAGQTYFYRILPGQYSTINGNAQSWCNNTPTTPVSQWASGLATVEANNNYFFADGTHLYVNLADGSNPTAHTLETQTRNYTIDLADSSNITITNMSVEGGAYDGLRIHPTMSSPTDTEDSIKVNGVFAYDAGNELVQYDYQNLGTYFQGNIETTPYQGTGTSYPVTNDEVSESVIGQYVAIGQIDYHNNGIMLIDTNNFVSSNNLVSTSHTEGESSQSYANLNTGRVVSNLDLMDNQSGIRISGSPGTNVYNLKDRHYVGFGVQVGGGSTYSTMYGFEIYDGKGSTGMADLITPGVPGGGGTLYNGIDCNGTASYLSTYHGTIYSVGGNAMTNEWVSNDGTTSALALGTAACDYGTHEDNIYDAGIETRPDQTTGSGAFSLWIRYQSQPSLLWAYNGNVPNPAQGNAFDWKGSTGGDLPTSFGQFELNNSGANDIQVPATVTLYNNPTLGDFSPATGSPFIGMGTPIAAMNESGTVNIGYDQTPGTIETPGTLNSIGVFPGFSGSNATGYFTLPANTPVSIGTVGTYADGTTRSINLGSGSPSCTTDNSAAATAAITTLNIPITVGSVGNRGTYCVVTQVNGSSSVHVQLNYGGVSSASTSFQLQIDAPVFSVAGGTYLSAQTVTFTNSQAGSTYYYTTDGTTPTASSTLYTGPVTVSASETLKAVSSYGGVLSTATNAFGLTTATYVIGATPVTPYSNSSPLFSVFLTPQNITLTNSVSGANIYYTLDGSTPTTSSTLYTGPISLTDNPAGTMINAIATAVGYSQSGVYSHTFTIAQPTVTPTLFSLNGGTVPSGSSLALANYTPSSTIYYTTDGSTPTTSSSVYSAPLTLTTNQTVKALAVATNDLNSPVVSVPYTISGSTASAPIFSPAGGTYGSTQTVTFSSSTPGATFLYCVGVGCTPSISGTTVSVGSSETIGALTEASGYGNSSTNYASYVISSSSPNPSLSGAASASGNVSIH